MKKVVFNVSDMHCTNCAMKLQDLEDTLPGVHSVDASYQKAQMTVVFDETTVTEEKIIAATGKLGYHATVKARP